MKKSIMVKTSIFPYLLFSALLLNTSCKKNIDNEELLNIGLSDSSLTMINVQSNIDDTTQFNEQLPNDELVVYRPRKAYKEYKLWRDKITSNFGEVIEKYPCGTCDSSILLLKGKGVKIFISNGGTVSGGQISQKPTPASGDSIAYFLRNFRVNFSMPKNSSSSFLPISIGTFPGTTVKVGVIDTGIEPKLVNNFLYKSFWSSCIAGADRGWNFMNQNPNFSDNSSNKHGTKVTGLILKKVMKYKNNQMEILPVKTHNKNGVSDVARIACALAYAKERGVKIINASFGFYSVIDNIPHTNEPQAILLKKYIMDYLTDNEILMVAAAGNKDDVNQKAAFEMAKLPLPIDLRNLDGFNFLPASLASELPNVIAVTTVDESTKDVSPDQNYSSNVVDLGVDADKVKGSHYLFQDPFLGNKATLEGSSYATAIVTGILCANYDKFKHIIKNKNFNKEDLWKVLNKATNGNVTRHPDLKKKIKGGWYVKN